MLIALPILVIVVAAGLAAFVFTRPSDPSVLNVASSGGPGTTTDPASPATVAPSPGTSDPSSSETTGPSVPASAPTTRAQPSITTATTTTPGPGAPPPTQPPTTPAPATSGPVVTSINTASAIICYGIVAPRSYPLTVSWSTSNAVAVTVSRGTEYQVWEANSPANGSTTFDVNCDGLNDEKVIIIATGADGSTSTKSVTIPIKYSPG